MHKDYKIGKINTEIEFTIKRLIRLLNCEENRKKDFEYYLKHFNKRTDYLTDWFPIINWEQADQRYRKCAGIQADNA